MGQEGDYCIEFARKLGDEFSRISRHVSDIQVGRLSLLILSVDKNNNSTAIEHNSTHFTRFSLFSDLEGSEQIKLLCNCREKASQIEEFFIGVSTELWLRTVLKCNQVSDENLTIQSNVVPCHQYWEKRQVEIKKSTNYAADPTARGFPSTYFEMSDIKLKAHFTNTREKKIQEEIRICELMTEQTTGGTNSGTDQRPFWKTEPEDTGFDDLHDELAGSNGKVRKMLWRGGRFASKVFKKYEEKLFIKELEVLKIIGTHPYIVYSFGVSIDSIPEDGSSSYWMELMDTDLFALVEDLSKGDVTSMDPMDSMDILLHIAEAMKHLHVKNVGHGDLKPDNVLVSHCEVLGGVRHYITKLADFDHSYPIPSNDLEYFEISKGTHMYAPPELRGTNKIRVNASDAKKSEVYPFGVLAVHVLTGSELDRIENENTQAENHFQDCGKNYDPRLKRLIHECLSIEPADRPSFEDLTTQLKNIIDSRR